MKRKRNAKSKQKSLPAASVIIDDGRGVNDCINTIVKEIGSQNVCNLNMQQECVEEHSLADATLGGCLKFPHEGNTLVQTNLSKRDVVKAKMLRDFTSPGVEPKKNTDQVQNGKTRRKKTKGTRSTATRSSRRLSSLDNSDQQLPNQLTSPKEQNLLLVDPDYNEQELKALLEVIRNVMKMDAAKPFNVPVDAVAFGIPDYHDVIDTPMDFGTICDNLEKGVQYKNAWDVLKDVQQIWDNCCKYNKKGHPILELMKKVKRNFLKLWADAQLYEEQQKESDGLMEIQQNSPGSAPRRSIPQPPTPLVPTPSQPVPAAATETPSSPTLSLQLTVPAATPSPRTPSSPAFSLSPLAAVGSPFESSSGLLGEGSSGAKRKRSHTQPKEGWNSGKQVYHLQFNEFMQVVGSNQASFASQLGVLAKKGTLLPLTYTSWRCKDLDDYKEVVWEEIKRNTNCPEAFKDVCMKDLGRKWSNWKAEVKKHYLKFATDEERLNNCPPRVEIKQWPILVAWFGGEEAQMRSAQNKANSNKPHDRHRTGRRPHAVIREKLKREGKRHDRVEVYKKTRNPSDAIAAAKIAKIDELLAPVKDDDQTTEIRENVFVEVMGPDRSGRVRTMGIGLTPKQVPGSSSHSSQLLHAKVREELRGTLRVELEAEMNERLEATLQAREAEMKARFEDTMQAREAEIKARFEATMQAREAEMNAREAERQSAFDAQIRVMKEMIELLTAREPRSCAQQSNGRMPDVADVSARSGGLMEHCLGGSAGKQTNQTTKKKMVADVSARSGGLMEHCLGGSAGKQTNQTTKKKTVARKMP